MQKVDTKKIFKKGTKLKVDGFDLSSLSSGLASSGSSTASKPADSSSGSSASSAGSAMSGGWWTSLLSIGDKPANTQTQDLDINAVIASLSKNSKSGVSVWIYVAVIAAILIPVIIYFTLIKK